MEGFGAGLENKDGKKAAVIDNVTIGVGVDFGLVPFPFFFGNVGDAFEVLGSKVLQVDNIEEIMRPYCVCEIVVFPKVLIMVPCNHAFLFELLQSFTSLSSMSGKFLGLSLIIMSHVMVLQSKAEKNLLSCLAVQHGFGRVLQSQQFCSTSSCFQ